MKKFFFAAAMCLAAMTGFSQSVETVKVEAAVDSVAVDTVVIDTTAVMPTQGKTVYLAPVEKKFETVVLIVKNAGFDDEKCTFLYGGKYYIGENLAYEIAKCYKVGFRLVATASDPSLGAVHYVLERPVSE